MTARRPLFSCFGVELEYMIVDAQTLDVRPIADELLRDAAGTIVGDVDFERTSWSNELVLHVIELKTREPAEALAGVADAFQVDVGRMNELLAARGARLLPSGMHPWMEPLREARLWPHEYSAVYEAFNRIFDCRGHGWSNLQAVHLNLPFSSDDEFARLHAAVRVILPLLPALAASSPFRDGRGAGLLDARLEAYRGNSRRIPSVAGRIIPEPVYSEAAYEREILQRIYADLAPHDPDGVLRDEFANARGAIARFSRGSIEIRVLDVQECPAADLAILALVIDVLRALCDERWASLERLQAVPVEPLERVLLDAIRRGPDAEVSDPYARLLDLPTGLRTAGALWGHWMEQVVPVSARNSPLYAPLEVILQQGPLATRILRAAGRDPDRVALQRVYTELAECLAHGRMFEGV